MPLAPGSKLGPYTITGPIGEGGMGVVYKAHDPKLQRDVAVKVLPDSLAHDPERLARFEREARALAALNHPNIAQVYGLEGTALIMELVDGPTLEDRIKQGAVDAAETVVIAKQIANALEAAHEKNIIHRDLKPANVKITPAGVVKLLDFGLAKAIDEAPQQPPSSDSPTLTMRPTEAGLILGTAAYMSPDQARGGNVDKRTDIWAFGVVLYEMLTGKRLFAGETVSDVLAAVLKQEIDLSKLPKDAPIALIEKCLQRDRKLRLRDIADASFDKPAQAATAQTPKWPIPAIAAALLIGAAGAWLLNKPRPQELPHRAFSFTAANLTENDFTQRAVISPNGKYIVYGAQEKLWLRDLAEEQPRALPGTEDAEGPFWSPDSTQIGFAVSDRLVKLSINGVTPFTIARLKGEFRSAAWSPDGKTIVASTQFGGLHEVSASGGEIRDYKVQKSGAGTFYSLNYLPASGKRLLLASHGNRFNQTVELLDLDTQTSETLLTGGYPVFAQPGHIVFQREPRVPGLWAVPISTATWKPAREPVPLINTGGNASVSSDQSLTWVDPDDAASRPLSFGWFGLDGKPLGVFGEPQTGALSLSLSPDGKRVIFAASERDNTDVWMIDVNSGVRTRLTFGPASDTWPVWSPTGKEFAYASQQSGGFRRTFVQSVDGGTKATPVTNGLFTDYPAAWSPDGRTILIVRNSQTERADVFKITRNSDGSFSEPTAFIVTPFSESAALFSPDGEYVLYNSNESGRRELYIVKFPSGDGKRQVTGTGVATGGRWSADGKKIYYISGGAVYSAAVSKEGGTLSVGQSEKLFQTPLRFAVEGFTTLSISPDGKRLLLPVPVANPDAKPPAIHFVQNWPALLRQKLPE